MTPRALKDLVQKIRLSCPDQYESGGVLTLREAADRSTEAGYGILNLDFWRKVTANGAFPSTKFASRWVIRRDHLDELFRQLAARAF